MASSSSASMSSWMRFFTEAGIPENVAANYAITFADHRIAMSMLLDLNKEILHDVGVTVMGDVIAVLKHAKVVHERVAREKLLKTQSPVVSVAPVLTNRVTPAANSEVPVPTAATAAIRKNNAPGRIVLKRKVDGTSAVALPPPKALSSAWRYVAPVASSSPAVAKPRLVVSQRSRPATSSKPSVFNRLDEKPGTVAKDAPKTESTANSVFDRLGPGQSDVVLITKGPKDRKLAAAPLKATDSPKTKVLTVNEAKKRFPTLAQKVARASKQTHGILGHGGPSTDRVRTVVRSSREEPEARREPSGSSNVFGRLGPRAKQ